MARQPRPPAPPYLEVRRHDDDLTTRGTLTLSDAALHHTRDTPALEEMEQAAFIGEGRARCSTRPNLRVGRARRLEKAHMER